MKAHTHTQRGGSYKKKSLWANDAQSTMTGAKRRGKDWFRSDSRHRLSKVDSAGSTPRGARGLERDYSHRPEFEKGGRTTVFCPVTDFCL